jgi:7,8-dihydropterin-6-yl-methyl-4-(beta-D-ribofuranosyl)aminobenzene 5'-phosphate synthase
MAEKLRLTVLIENTAPAGLAAEHGLSLWVEYGAQRWLLDAGRTGAFAANAAALGIDLAAAQGAVLSHAHYDHADGLAAFFAANRTAPLYLRDSCAENCWHVTPEKRRYIGIRQGLLAENRARLRPVSGVYRLAPGAFLVPHDTPDLAAAGAAAGMYREDNGALRPDDFSHEQSFVLDTAGGLVILNSCSHGGADNILREVRAALPGRPVCAFVGGLHLMALGEEQVRAYAARLAQQTPPPIYTGHCTGEPALALLAKTLPCRVSPITTGTVLTF